MVTDTPETKPVLPSASPPANTNKVFGMASGRGFTDFGAVNREPNTFLASKGNENTEEQAF